MNKKFKCSHCGRWVSVDRFIGTAYRNHCPFCLWSKHVDLKKSGDRQARCQGEMEPIGLTFKHEGWDKWGKLKQGELMLIHRCNICGKISINRIAADDEPQAILAVFRHSGKIDKRIKELLSKSNIKLLGEEDETEIKNQLFGKNIL